MTSRLRRARPKNTRKQTHFSHFPWLCVWTGFWSRIIQLHCLLQKQLSLKTMITELYLETKGYCVDGDNFLSCVVLQRSSEKGLWEEKARDPENLQRRTKWSFKQHSVTQWVYGKAHLSSSNWRNTLPPSHSHSPRLGHVICGSTTM